MELTFQYQKKRSEFGRQCIFNDKGPDLIDNYYAEHNLMNGFIYKDPINVGVQNSTTQAEHELNTYRAEYSNSGINHIEGGWPRDVNTADEEQTKRYKRKVEKEENYFPTMSTLCKNMEDCILQNNAINIYQQYYTDVEPAPIIEPSQARTVNVFIDQYSVPRPITHTSWAPDGGTKIVVSYCNMLYQAVFPIAANRSFIWELENPNVPFMVLEPETPSVCIEYNNKDPNFLVSGQMNGLIAVWDLRKSNKPVKHTIMEESHRDPVHSVQWINSKSGTEFFSGSTDGTVKWWDTRKIEEPIETLILDPVKPEEQSISNAMGCTVLEYESTIPTRFMVGTENGCVISGNRKGKLPLEKMVAKYTAHLGPVLALQRNAAFVKNFLTVGDWSARIWSEDCKESSIMWTYNHKARLLDGAWSPTRYSVFFTCRSDGILDVWDILQTQEHATISVKICDEPLTSMRVQEGGRLNCVGNQKGTTHIVELSESLSYSNKNDKALLTAMFERENKREKILEARNRELRLKQRTKSGQAGTSIVPKEKEFIFYDTNVKNAEREFFEIIDKETRMQEEEIVEEEEEEMVPIEDAVPDDEPEEKKE